MLEWLPRVQILPLAGSLNNVAQNTTVVYSTLARSSNNAFVFSALSCEHYIDKPAKDGPSGNYLCITITHSIFSSKPTMASSSSTSAVNRLPDELWSRIIDFYLDGKALPTIRYNSIWTHRWLSHISINPGPPPANTPSPEYFSEYFLNGLPMRRPRVAAHHHALATAMPGFSDEYWRVQMLKHALIHVDLDSSTLRDPARLAAVFHPDPVPRQARYLSIRILHSDSLRGTYPQTIADMHLLRTWLHQFPNLELLALDCVQHPHSCVFPQLPCGPPHWLLCACGNAPMLPITDWLAADRPIFSHLERVWIMRQKWGWDQGQAGFVSVPAGPGVPLSTREAWWRMIMDKVHKADGELVAWRLARAQGGEGT